MRLYSAGIDSFARLREDGRIYVDKTGLIYRLAKESHFVFLNRPRRFGKTLLCSTMECYFQGRKELFDGLEISKYEKDWKKYPVFRFDLSGMKNQIKDIEVIQEALSLQLNHYEDVYGRNDAEKTPGERLSGLIYRAHEQTGLRAVVIIDEYDSPLLDPLYKDILPEVSGIVEDLCQHLKISSKHEQFVFITGITKFSDWSISSYINLSNISMLDQYSELCGFTKDEILSVYEPDIRQIAENNGCTFEEMVEKLRWHYDGYHFSEHSEGIYNPFSLTNVMLKQEIGNYWFDSGSPKCLFDEYKKYNNNDLLSLPQITVSSSQFDVPAEAMFTVLPLLYQAGYLTIKHYEPLSHLYTLDFPNAEVKVGFLRNFFKYVLGIKNVYPENYAGRIYKALYFHDLDTLFNELQEFFASIPYMDNDDAKELENVTKYESFYEVITYIVFSMLSGFVQTHVKTASGRTDVVVYVKDTVYVMELKLDGSAEEALAQIDSKEYYIPYQSDNKNVVKIGMAFSSEKRTIVEHTVEAQNFAPRDLHNATVYGLP